MRPALRTLQRLYAMEIGIWYGSKQHGKVLNNGNDSQEQWKPFGQMIHDHVKPQEPLSRTVWDFLSLECELHVINLIN